MNIEREILRGDQTKQAEIVPFALDQVNTCVGNVLPLPGPKRRCFTPFFIIHAVLRGGDVSQIDVVVMMIYWEYVTE